MDSVTKPTLVERVLSRNPLRTPRRSQGRRLVLWRPNGNVQTEPPRRIRPALRSLPSTTIPGVSRSVARDLRRRYGEDYRIIRADSGQQALDALQEMKLRGDLVALLLADYRMPQMNGIEFLEEAMDLYPTARRVLLTAYADTNAAIDAINVVDLDHYLLKPWDPPEEKLYPVLDDLLAGVAGHRPSAGARDQGRGPPLVGSFLRCARVPRPQPGALPVVSRPTTPRAGGCSPPPPSMTAICRW